MKRSLKVVAASVALATLLSGCFGSFGATRWLYNVNDSVSNKFVKTLVMWCFTILPAYAIFMFGDWLILNTVEFWVGHPLVSNTSYDVMEDGSLLVQFDNDSMRLIPVDDNRMLIEHAGAIVGDATKSPDNTLTLTNYTNAETRVLTIPSEM